MGGGLGPQVTAGSLVLSGDGCASGSPQNAIARHIPIIIKQEKNKKCFSQTSNAGELGGEPG